jgi:FdhD protein
MAHLGSDHGAAPEQARPRPARYAPPVPGSRDIRHVDLLAVAGGAAGERSDPIAVEEPLEIRAEGPGQPASAIAVTMRTPGHEAELAVGFLFTEGLIHGPEDVQRPPVRELIVEGGANNVVTVRLAAPFDAERLKRNFYATSSCGICGKASLEHLHATAPPMGEPRARFARSTLVRLPAALREAQVVFERTGGLHATGVFDRDGRLLVARGTWGGTTRWTRRSGGCCSTGRSPSASASSWSPAA